MPHCVKTLKIKRIGENKTWIWNQCSDEELIVRYRDGDTDAMDFIFERYKHLVRKKAKAMFLAGGDNDDLIQEGMIGLYKESGL